MAISAVLRMFILTRNVDCITSSQQRIFLVKTHQTLGVQNIKYKGTITIVLHQSAIASSNTDIYLYENVLVYSFEGQRYWKWKASPAESLDECTFLRLFFSYLSGTALKLFSQSSGFKWV